MSIISEYLSLVPEAAMKATLETRKAQLESDLATCIINYQLEEGNESYTNEDDKLESLRILESRISVFGKALKECNKRLNEAKKALEGE